MLPVPRARRLRSATPRPSTALECRYRVVGAAGGVRSGGDDRRRVAGRRRGDGRRDQRHGQHHGRHRDACLCRRQPQHHRSERCPAERHCDRHVVGCAGGRDRRLRHRVGEHHTPLSKSAPISKSAAIFMSARATSTASTSARHPTRSGRPERRVSRSPIATSARRRPRRLAPMSAHRARPFRARSPWKRIPECRNSSQDATNTTSSTAAAGNPILIDLVAKGAASFTQKKFTDFVAVKAPASSRTDLEIRRRAQPCVQRSSGEGLDRRDVGRQRAVH